MNLDMDPSAAAPTTTTTTTTTTVAGVSASEPSSASVPVPIPAQASAPASVQDRPAYATETEHKPSAPMASRAISISDNPPHFSWLQPHTQFVVVLVGPEETPFGLQQDFLCAQSSYYRKHFAAQSADAVESIVRLPDTSVDIFGLAQHFMYTGILFPDDAEMPSYEMLVSVWKLGHDLGIEGLCDRTLETMIQVRQATERIPGAPLLVQVWRDTPEGSTIRVLLLAWAAEYMRSSKSNAEFAKSLPQEVLSELVLAMSRPDTTPLVQLRAHGSAAIATAADAAAAATTTVTPNPAQSRRKTVHYIDEEEELVEDFEPAYLPQTKKQRRQDPFVDGSGSKAVARKAKSAAPPKAAPRRRSQPSANGETQEFTEEQKLAFCQDLLVRMLSGPGFWTRLVGPFREPVDPVRDSVPDYFEKVTTPMDLITMKGKMDRNEYKTHEDFFADMSLIFSNCKTYWKPGQTVYVACEKLEKTFMDKYSGMNKWLAKIEGNEEH